MEYYEIKKNKTKLRTDRYKNCDILVDKDTGDTLLATREIESIPVKPTDMYHRVASHEIGRLDIIANNYYKNSLLWWVIAEANEIRNPFEDMRIGAIIRIPTIETLYGNKGILL